MTKFNDRTVLASLKQSLRDSPKNWLAIGDAMEVLEQHSARNNHGVAWHVVVAEIYLEETQKTISKGYLNKICRVRDFVRELQTSENVSVSDDMVLASSIGALEIASRIYKLDRGYGIESFSDSVQSKKSISQIQNDYDKLISENIEVVSDKSLTWRNKRKSFSYSYDREKKIEDFIRSNLEIFGVENQDRLVLVPQPLDKLVFFHDTSYPLGVDHIFVNRVKNNNTTIGVFFADASQRKDKPITAEVADFRSSLYDQYWILVSDLPDFARIIAKTMERLYITRTGVINICSDGGYNIYRQPKLSNNKADRRDLVWDYINSSLTEFFELPRD